MNERVLFQKCGFFRLISFRKHHNSARLLFVCTMEVVTEVLTELNVDQHRHSHESNSEWGLRRQFLLAHGGDLQVDRLLCMASCFVNVECYGCTYPDPVMRHLKTLTESLQDTVDEHREAARKKTEVKFVPANGGAADKPASSAAMESYSTKKGRQGMQTIHRSKTLAQVSFVKSTDKYQTTGILPQDPVSRHGRSVHHSTAGGSGTTNSARCQLPEIYSKPHPLDNKFYKLRAHMTSSNAAENSIQILQRTVFKVNMNLTVEFEIAPHEKFCCVVFIDSVKIGTGTKPNKKGAKHAAFDDAIVVLSSKQLHVVGNGDDLELHGTNIQINPSKIESPATTSRKRKSPPVALSEFIIIESVAHESSNATSVLNQSIAFNKMTLTYDFRNHDMNGVNCQLCISDFPLADATARIQSDAKKLATEKAMVYLRENNWTIRIKKFEDTDDAGISKEQLLGEIQTNEASKAIPASNIGNKLLMKMGWTGGGVGKEGNKGIAEPVSAVGVIKRSGLGFFSDKGIDNNFIPKISQTLVDYLRSGNEGDVTFAKDFSKEERALIHTECRKLGLKSQGRGTGLSRYMVVSRKRSAGQLFSRLMGCGGETSKYVLIPPGQAMPTDEPTDMC